MGSAGSGEAQLNTEKEAVMLIVDDVEINRAILRQFFKNEYIFVEAANGQEALDVLERQRVDIVLLDMVMPVMDGFQLLTIMKQQEKFSDIPVVVTTVRNEGDSEVKAMELGADDFVTKPYNPTIVRIRVHNVMARREVEWSRLEQAAKDFKIMEMRAAMEHDSLTGLLKRESFYTQTATLLQNNADKEYAIVYFDISYFKSINDLFHVEMGNLVLKNAASYFALITNGVGLAARLEADHFAICMPIEDLHMDAVMQGLDDAMSRISIAHSITFYAGVYKVANVYLSVEKMCDMAHMALYTVKGKPVQRYTEYDEKMESRIEEERMVVREMEFALSEKQFKVYLQPIYSVSEDRCVAAEALVRWIHPTRGLIPPDHFIGIFERNGFIQKLDRYVWETVCMLQQNRIMTGKSLIPISVNVSRINFYNVDFVNELKDLVHKYHVGSDALRFEITETAYMENPQQLLSVMKELQKEGFVFLMDDFGSGYSSLNMLKNVPVDILKLDMGFMRDLDKNDKVEYIIKAVVQMAKNLKMDMVCEGVETASQLEFLKSIGCDKIQGYYFSKPLPVDEFTEWISNFETNPGGYKGEQEKQN